jgi:hypothetical protein
MGMFTMWRKKHEIEKDSEAACGHRCFYLEGKDRTAFCDKYEAGDPKELRMLKDRDGMSACLDTDLSFISVGQKGDRKYFYKCNI